MADGFVQEAQKRKEAEEKKRREQARLEEIQRKREEEERQRLLAWEKEQEERRQEAEEKKLREQKRREDLEKKRIAVIYLPLPFPPFFVLFTLFFFSLLRNVSDVGFSARAGETRRSEGGTASANCRA
jgi:Fe2+ transport system protein B